MNDFKKIMSQLVSLQKQLSSSTERDQINYFNLRQLADIAETFMDNSPNLEIQTNKDEVIVSGEIPNILSPQDISVKLEGNILLRIECRWYKNGEAGLKPQELKKKIELPYPVNPATLSVTYQKGILRISAKREVGTNTWTAQAQFLD
mgnify:CR=1 FL=1